MRTKRYLAAVAACLAVPSATGPAHADNGVIMLRVLTERSSTSGYYQATCVGQGLLVPGTREYRFVIAAVVVSTYVIPGLTVECWVTDGPFGTDRFVNTGLTTLGFASAAVGTGTVPVGIDPWICSIVSVGGKKQGSEQCRPEVLNKNSIPPLG